jgi:hypothetical protein
MNTNINKGKKFYQGFNHFSVMPKLPNVLFAFITGTNAIAAEGMSNATMMNLSLDLLKASFPNYPFPKPVEFFM